MRKSSEKCMRKSSEKRLETRNKVMAPDQTSSLINKEKTSIAAIQYKTLFTESILNTFFFYKTKTNKQTNEKVTSKQTSTTSCSCSWDGYFCVCLAGIKVTIGQK